MARCNHVYLFGNVGSDPFPLGDKGIKVSLATEELWTDKDGQKQKRTEWHNLVFWGATANVAKAQIKKGMSMFVEGKISTSSWETKTGTKAYQTQIVVEFWRICSYKVATQQETAEDMWGANSQEWNSPESNNDELPF